MQVKKMEEQELEWAEAQKIAISEDLAAAAKQQLRFLAEVDRRRHLYEDDPALNQAIYRYKCCWLPLLAKHDQTSQVSEGPLVVPLDCEWIWHCHRLNPVRYKNDCEDLYGRILGKGNVVSSTQAICKKQSEEVWNNLYPCEPFELNINTLLPSDARDYVVGAQKSTNYDLVSAVRRQAPFYYQVSRPYMNDDRFLEGAVARYKGFLHLIKRNQERSIRRFCVPTYDIDLIWHTHQLHPVSYRKDLEAIIGRVLEHDDTDSDRTKGKKLDNGFSGTTKQWEETFGLRYWRAGAMYRGSGPSPLTINLSEVGSLSKKADVSINFQNMIHLQKKMLVEVMLELVGVGNLSVGHKGSLYIICSKRKPDMLFHGRRRLTILPEEGEKQVTVFQCEPEGELVCELVSCSSSILSIARPSKLLGTVSISLEDLMKPGSPLSVQKRFELEPMSVGSNPINLHIALSFTPPVEAPFRLHMFRKPPLTSSCCFPTPGRAQLSKHWTCFVDEAGKGIINLQIRDSSKMEDKDSFLHKKEVIGMVTNGETHVLAEFDGKAWCLLNSSWWFQLQKKVSNGGNIFELTGSKKVMILPGRKLEYETGYANHKSELNFMTAVEFTAENPYGKAVALFNLKSGFIEINQERLVLPGILLAAILSADAQSTGLMDDASKLHSSGIPKMDSRCCWGSARN